MSKVWIKFFSFHNTKSDISRKPRKSPKIAISKLLAEEQQSGNCNDLLSPCSTITSAASLKNKQFDVGSSVHYQQQELLKQDSKFLVLQNIELNGKNKEDNIESSGYPVPNSGLKEKVGKRQNYIRNNKKNGFSMRIPPLCLTTDMSKKGIAVEGWVICLDKYRLPHDKMLFSSQDLYYMWCCKSTCAARGELHFWKPYFSEKKYVSPKLRRNQQSKSERELFQSLTYEDVKMQWISPFGGHGISVTSKDENNDEQEELIILPTNLDNDMVANNLKEQTILSSNNEANKNVKISDIFVHRSRKLNKHTKEDTPSLPTKAWSCNSELISSSRQTDTTLHFLFCMDVVQKKKLHFR